MSCLYSNWTPTYLLGGGALPLDSKVIGMLVIFFRVQSSDFGIFLVSSGKSCAEMKFWYFLGSAHFPY